MRAAVAISTLLAGAPAALARNIPRQTSSCPLVFDGRIPSWANGSSFDAGKLPYNNAYDLGAGQTWATDLVFPNTSQSLFDNSSTKAVEVTISDASIFTPSPGAGQTGFRRTELLPTPADVADSVSGIKTLHWSMMSDPMRPLNYSHEYQLVWLESADYSADQFTLGAGILYPGEPGVSEAQGKVLFLRGSDIASPQQTIWQTPFEDGVWYNFGLRMDFDANALELYYSTGNSSLQSVVASAADNLSGQGEFHFGVLKKPTGQVSDITKEGYQEEGIHEGIVYGGIFEEDSSGGCVSTAPA